MLARYELMKMYAIPAADLHSHGDRFADRSAVVISGVGLVSPLGDGAWPTFTALLAGKSLHDRAKALHPDVDPVTLVQHVGHVATAMRSATDPTVDLAERAAREALFMAQADLKTTVCLLATSKGAVKAVIGTLDGYDRCKSRDGAMSQQSCSGMTSDAQAVVLGPHGYLAHHLARRLGCSVKGHIVTACASSLTALHQGRLALLRSHATPSQDLPSTNRCLIVTCEASLIPLFIASYRRLGVLPPLQVDRYRALPLDQHRCGFVPSQIGAAVVLERVDSVKPGQIELVDTAIAAEAFDLVRSNPDMPALNHIAQQLLTGRSIDLLHPHATGTVDHDPAELTVLGRHITHPTDVYACKGALGHGLGASGLVSLVLAWLCAKSHRRPPMTWLNEPIKVNNPLLTLSHHARQGRHPSHAVFATGFGGHVAGAVIQRRT